MALLQIKFTDIKLQSEFKICLYSYGMLELNCIIELIMCERTFTSIANMNIYYHWTVRFKFTKVLMIDIQCLKRFVAVALLMTY